MFQIRNFLIIFNFDLNLEWLNLPERLSHLWNLVCSSIVLTVKKVKLGNAGNTNQPHKRFQTAKQMWITIVSCVTHTVIQHEYAIFHRSKFRTAPISSYPIHLFWSEIAFGFRFATTTFLVHHTHTYIELTHTSNTLGKEI